jgi:cardiolipin synthase
VSARAPKTRKTKQKTILEIELWMFGIVVALLLVLIVMLWSAMRGRRVHVALAGVDSLREGIPSIVGATHGVLFDGNEIEVLQNGDGFFPRVLADIAAARESIHLETYVWWRGEICRQVAGALAAKAREGVAVRVLLDASGSAKMDRDLLKRMREAGCKVSKYRPFRFSNIARVNSRDHRKLLVVDGRVGYVFGHGIGDEWLGDGQDAEHWRDTGARLRGPIVGSLQSCFTENWVEETGEVLAGDRYFPKLEPAGNTPAHLAYHFNHGSVSAVDLLYRLAFASARRELIIQNPYLAADSAVLDLLGAAAERGVDVRIMLPGAVTDAQFVRHAGHYAYRALLERGVRLFEYHKTLNHQKILIVDGQWSHIGSTNLDNRSFESNDEISLGMVDARIAAELAAAFAEDAASAVEVKLEEWDRRSWAHKLRDALSYRFNEIL